MKKQTMGELIAELRKERGMTQAELAAKMGITDKAVSKWERNLSCPDVESLPRLAELFGITLDELMRVKESGTKTDGRADAMVGLVLRGITLAMGVAVVVTSILGEIDAKSAFVMLGVGLGSAGVYMLMGGGRDK